MNKDKEQIDKDFEEVLAMSKTGQICIPTSEFSFMVNAIEAQDEAIQRVRELHKPYWNEIVFCQTCDYPYPCDTIRALDGEQ